MSLNQAVTKPVKQKMPNNRMSTKAGFLFNPTFNEKGKIIMKNILSARPDLDTANGEDTHLVSITFDPKKYPKAEGILDGLGLYKQPNFKNAGKIKMSLVHEKDEPAFNSTYNSMKANDRIAMAKRGMIIDAQREIREDWESKCGIEDPKKAASKADRVAKMIVKLTEQLPDKSKAEIKEIAENIA